MKNSKAKSHYGIDQLGAIGGSTDFKALRAWQVLGVMDARTAERDT
jgi:hypothetical protein